MNDECRHCTIRGDMCKCQEEECSKHMSWYAQAITAENRTLQHENAILIDALREMHMGEATWDMLNIATEALKQVEA